MFETATLRSGFTIGNSADFASRIERMMRIALDVDLNEKVCNLQSGRISICH
jgi:heat shock protein beta